MKILLFIVSCLIASHAYAGGIVDKAFIGAAKASNIDVRLLRAVCWVESGHKANTIVYNDGGSPSYGMCQVKLNTARKNKYKGDVAGLIYPITNAYVASQELSRWLRVCKGDWRRAVASYNRGHYSHARFNGYVALVTFALNERR